MATYVFCRHCAQRHGWPIPSIRVTTDVCESCGGHDQIRKRKRTANGIIEVTENLKNFEHDARFLEGTPQYERSQQPLGDG